MDKRKNKTLAAALLIFLVMGFAGVFIFKPGANYRLKNGPVIAAEYSSDLNYNQSKKYMRQTAKYLKEEGINTLILPFNSGSQAVVGLEGFESYGEKSGKKDVIHKYKSVLGNKRIQMFIMIDCSDIPTETVYNAVAHISKEYEPAAVVLDNFSGSTEDIKQLRENAVKQSRKTKFFVKTLDKNTIRDLSASCGADGFVAEYMNYEDYMDLKTTVDKPVLLHHTSPTMARDVFLLTNMTSSDGAVVTQYKTEETGKKLMIQPVFKENENMPFFGFGVTDKFTLTYPTKDFTTYYKGFFILGTGERGGIVTVNDIPYRAEKDGTFGIYYELKQGTNVVTISQNGQSKTFTVVKKSYSSSGSGTSYPQIPYIPQDNLPANEQGIILQTVSNLNSLLSDPGDDSAIIRGLDPGIKLKAVGRVPTTRNGETVNAYKLSNGAYILEKNVRRTGEMALSIKNFGTFDKNNMKMYDVPTIKGGKLERQKNGDEILTVNVNNMPAVIANKDEEKLTLHFLDTEVIPVQSWETLIDTEKSAMFSHSVMHTKDDGTYLELYIKEGAYLWGWDISVKENSAVIYLKQAPAIAKGDKPLQGVTVMLDPGHGGKDSGALGVAATHGPMEKDLNLAVAQTAKSLFEQWGATVIMTRDEDSFPSLDDRRNLCRAEKPDFFIAVHHNSMDYSYDSTKARGSECYYFNGHSEQLATLLCDEITLATGRINRGADTGYYYVTRTDICPSALMEYSFIINPKDYAQTYNEIDIYKAAFGTLQAVLKAIPQEP